ncbi:DUF5305 domain-containing protein [Halosimplex sp. J119]
MGEDRRIRVRAIVGRWFGGIVIASLVVGATGAVLVHGAYLEPGTHQEQRVVDEWSVNGSFAHGSIVTGAADETPFRNGEAVRGRTVYFQRIMPVLTGEFRLRTPGANAPVNLTIDRRLLVESADAARGDEEPTVYWRDTRPLGTDRTVKQPGETATVPFELNVTRTVAHARNVSQRLGAPGQIRTRLLVTVVATRQTSGAETRRFTYALPIDAESGIYRVETTPSTERFTEREMVTVPNDPGPFERLGGPLLLLCGVIGAIGLTVAQWRDAIALSDAEREWLTYRNDRADFEEWITAIRLPAEARNLPVAHAETLADLVDFAIDTDSAVMEEPNGGAYHVVHDGYRYTYEAPAAPTADPLRIPGDAEVEGDAGTDSDAGEGRPTASESGEVVADGARSGNADR